MFAVQSEVAEAVAGQLGGYNGTIVTADLNLAKRKRPEDLGAYDQYLVGLAESQSGLETGHRGGDPLVRAQRCCRSDPRPRLDRPRAELPAAARSDRGRPRPPSARDRGGAGAPWHWMRATREAAAALAFALGEQGDLAESEAMFDRALALNPSSAEILTAYASWASTFGKPEAGVEAAQRALRLNPNMPPAALAKNRYAFFMTGRYDEALRLNARIPREAYGRDDFIYRAVLLNETGNAGDAPGCGRGGAGAFPVDLGRGLVRPSRLQRCGTAALGGDDAQGRLSRLRRRPGAGRAVGGAAADRVRVAAGHMNVRRLPIWPRRRTLPSLDTRRLGMHV